MIEYSHAIIMMTIIIRNDDKLSNLMCVGEEKMRMNFFQLIVYFQKQTSDPSNCGKWHKLTSNLE